jgi:hypothetical protein
MILPEIAATKHKWDAADASVNGQSVMTAVGTS